MKNPKAYIMVGVPGSGKTTWINNQDWLKDCEYISTDRFVEKHALEQNKTYSEVFQEYMPIAVDLMTKQVIEARNQNKNIIWDQTSTTILSRLKKFRMLPDYYHIAVVVRSPDRLVLENRLNSRPGKIIPNEVINNIINNWEDPTKEEGYREIWYVN